MKKLNVCLINDSFPPLIDGVANAVVNYANIIQNNYGNVTVATPEYPDVVDDYCFDVLRYPSINTEKLVGYRTGNPFNIEYLSQFNNRNIDIIHSHCPITSTYLARILRDSIKKPIILTYHTKFDIDIERAIDSKLLQDASIAALVSNISAVDEVWTVSKGAGENLKSLGYKGDYIVMPNGVDFEKGRASDKEIAQIIEEYSLPTDVPLYLFVGRLMWYKGIKIIIDACNLKKQSGQDFRMIFVGSGGDETEIREYIGELQLSDKCIFTGAIRDRQKLKAVFSTCDLFLFPSTFDTNGIVVREAAAAGLGSVLIKDSCAAEDTLDGTNVIQIEENYKSLAEVLIRSGNDTDYFHRIGANAQDQLYMSWQQSVENAYQRYLYVDEKFQYNSRTIKPLDLSDSFFAMFANLSQGLTKAQQARTAVEDKIDEGKIKILEQMEEKIDQQIDELEQYRNKIIEKKLSIKRKANDEIDSYL